MIDGAVVRTGPNWGSGRRRRGTFAGLEATLDGTERPATPDSRSREVTT